jgi:hypothetical protein
MYTLIDFMTHIKGVEYLISVSAIALFIVFLEVLKPKPFKTLVDNAKEEVEYMKETGMQSTLRTVGRLLATPFIGLAYVVSLPFVFVYTFARELSGMAVEGLGRVMGMAGRTYAFGWRPTEAYLAGKQEKKEKAEKTEKSETAETSGEEAK